MTTNPTITAERLDAIEADLKSNSLTLPDLSDEELEVLRLARLGLWHEEQLERKLVWLSRSEFREAMEYGLDNAVTKKNMLDVATEYIFGEYLPAAEQKGD